jgi:hypothetical protein
MSKPTVMHWEQAKRNLRYLKGTTELRITFSGDISTEMAMWQDSSFADGDNMRSRTGIVAMMCGGTVAWGSRLQSTVALSTVEAEYMARCASSQEVLFFRQLLTNFNMAPSGSTRMLKDNNGCMALATNPMITGKTKHIDIRYHFIRDLVKSGEVVIKYCPTEDMVADALTKFSLPTTLHLKHGGRMLSGKYSGLAAI